ncbi:DNL zinc finger domain-containing protein [Cordyceps javanica]|uniref:DNL zinc finger domain-containing protein n=1 Tax=Cordyceps javanica TaxID=43265 RepID=A0A545VZK0_9HYPO|nr:DNL zinc finger domain-containing protein [Cordyceps javanica]TQW07150.1 DNL zinc finger domain containing protein [Cordyceps javanica]
MASRTASSLVRQLRPSTFRQPCRAAAGRLLRQPTLITARPALLVRAAHTIPRPPLPSERVQTEPATGDAVAEPPAWQPQDAPTSEGARPEAKNPAYYQLSFTCVPCGHRSHHNVSKQGYHAGSVLITCPSCRNRHVISDHLNIFGDRKLTVEDLMREKGRLVKRGSLGEDGDIEFWPDEEQGAETKTGSS